MPRGGYALLDVGGAMRTANSIKPHERALRRRLRRPLGDDEVPVWAPGYWVEGKVDERLIRESVWRRFWRWVGVEVRR